MASQAASFMQKFRNFVHTIIEQHQSTFDPDNIRDFTDLYLLSQMEHNEGNSKVSGKYI